MYIHKHMKALWLQAHVLTCIIAKTKDKDWKNEWDYARTLVLDAIQKYSPNDFDDSVDGLVTVALTMTFFTLNVNTSWFRTFASGDTSAKQMLDASLRSDFPSLSQLPAWWLNSLLTGLPPPFYNSSESPFRLCSNTVSPPLVVAIVSIKSFYGEISVGSEDDHVSVPKLSQISLALFDYPSPSDSLL